MLKTNAESYMLFKKGVEPKTEYEISPGVRATKCRFRSELSVRPQEFDSWQRAWEITVRLTPHVVAAQAPYPAPLASRAGPGDDCGAY